MSHAMNHGKVITRQLVTWFVFKQSDQEKYIFLLSVLHAAENLSREHLQRKKCRLGKTILSKNLLFTFVTHLLPNIT